MDAQKIANSLVNDLSLGRNSISSNPASILKQLNPVLFTKTDLESELSEINNISEDTVDNTMIDFYFLDAYEIMNGTLFLFGKVFCKRTNRFTNACIYVQMQRNLLILPKKPFTHAHVKNEFVEKIKNNLNIRNYNWRVVEKKNAFIKNLPKGPLEFLELSYHKGCPPIYVDNYKLQTFSKVLGNYTKSLDIFCLLLNITGPCWLNIKVRKNKTKQNFCALNLICYDYHLTKVSRVLNTTPSLTVVTLNVQVTAEGSIAIISCMLHNNFIIGSKSEEQIYNHHFCIINVENHNAEGLKEYLCTYAKTTIIICESEKELLMTFLNKFHTIDPDIIIGSDIEYIKNVVVTRSELNNVNAKYLGRLNVDDRRQSPFNGRVVCDLKNINPILMDEEHRQSNNFASLCKTVLQIEYNRNHIDVEEALSNYSNGLDDLIEQILQGLYLHIKIFNVLDILPVAIELSKLTGVVLSRIFNCSQLELTETCLLHKFNERGYVLPETILHDLNNGETLKGGKVLDPTCDIYHNIVLLMDFEAYYPNIIREFNLCFSTEGVIPNLLDRFIRLRRANKAKMLHLKPDDPKYKNCYVMQRMYKLMANSIFGCLGSQHSKFYNFELASIITQKGREILEDVASIITNEMKFHVLYGDTDSVMVSTGSKNYSDALKICDQITDVINKKYTYIKLKRDKVFHSIVIAGKKHYSGIYITQDNAKKLENKGGHMVRSEYPELIKIISSHVQQQILLNENDEDCAKIIMYMLRCATLFLKQTGVVSKKLFTIQKHIKIDLPENENECHTSEIGAAIRYNKKSNRRAVIKKGDYINYLICKDGSYKDASSRAYHIDDAGDYKIDMEYYTVKFLYPLIKKLCVYLPSLKDNDLKCIFGIKHIPVFMDVEVESGAIVVPKPFINKCYRCDEKVEWNKGDISVFMECKKCQFEPSHNIDHLVRQLKFQIEVSQSMIGDTNRSKCRKCKFIIIDDSNVTSCPECKSTFLRTMYSIADFYRQLIYYREIFTIASSSSDVSVLIHNICDILRLVVETKLNSKQFSLLPSRL